MIYGITCPRRMKSILANSINLACVFDPAEIDLFQIWQNNSYIDEPPV